MPVRTTGFAPTLARALVLPAVLFVLAAGHLVTVTVQAAGENRTVSTTHVDRDPVWRASYSRRFPGCVALVLWPQREIPRALLVRDRAGTVAAMTVREAAVRLRTADRSDDVRAVGACR